MVASPKSRVSYDVIETPSVVDNREPLPAPYPKWKEYLFGVPGILAGAIIGIILGWGLQKANPTPELTSWIAVPGDLFIRAIKCLVTPLVFCSLIVGMADMLAVGKASRIGWRTAMLYLITTIVASCEGMIWVLIFRPHFGNKAKNEEAVIPEMALQCEKPGYFLSHANDTIKCVFDESFNSTSEFSKSSVFLVTDINKSFATSATEFLKRSLSEALQGQLFAMVPDNITLAFSEGVLLSIIMFAIPFGVAISMLPRDMTIIANFFREINMVFMTMIKWIISCTPFAIISLLASSIMGQSDLGVLVGDVGLYVACVLCSLVVHTYIFYPLLLRAFVKCNPYAWIRKMARAQVFAFGCASSMATLPVVMECMDATNTISQTLSRFVLSLGATIGMDGAALGYPIAIVFMAEAEGIGHIIGGVEYFLIILVSTIGAVGSGPVPAAGIVMTMTIWNSVFPSVALPSTFAFIVATDWFCDRFQTAVNVTCDTIVCRIVAEQVGETIDQQERASLVSAVDGLVDHHPELKEALSVTRPKTEAA
ncbi:hypothetical protein Poli38472_003540 [Pythium oligandrum]|uniref:Amino acid transporter n=1 Tax=Pythium oligandrum TaxID=41045 RepID=A0A8K1FBT3_PYTOL|nr:hypothetical protein Poli38472_003540 [Pythium oligandrum]|eukprot:TMW57615.1 hypothetical protein Poli38472_003540 [Pythium oligandrum]